MVSLPSKVTRNGISPDEIESLAEQGKPVLVSGPAWIGQQGFTARVVLILGRNSEGFIKGWVFCHRYDKPEEFSDEGLKRIDDSKENNPVVYEPWYYDVCAEVDFSVIGEDSPEEIQELIDWALGDDPKKWESIRKHLAKRAREDQ